MIRRIAETLGITRRSLLLNAAAVAAITAFVLVIGNTSDDLSDLRGVLGFLGVFFIQLIIPVYLHFGLWRFTVASKRYGWYALGAVVLVLGWPLVAAAAVLSLGLDDAAPSYGQILSNTLFGILLATGIRAIYRSFRRERELRELRRRQTESELAGLKAQLNPHFLFNTLNNIYGLNLDDPSRGSDMILELADVMRYHLELSQRKEVPLADELALIRSVAQLEALRLRENTTVRLYLPADDAIRGVTIPPLLLVPFVENAFKHGTHPAHAGEVLIRLTLTPDPAHPDALTFETRNPIYPDRQTVSTGVGEANVRQRLRLLYGERAEIATGPRDGHYEVRLRLPLPAAPSGAHGDDTRRAR